MRVEPNIFLSIKLLEVAILQESIKQVAFSRAVQITNMEGFAHYFFGFEPVIMPPPGIWFGMVIYFFRLSEPVEHSGIQQWQYVKVAGNQAG